MASQTEGESVRVSLDDLHLIVSDVDGTLLTKQHTLHAATIDGIVALRKRKPSLPFIIATGRQRNSCAFVREALGIDGLYETIHMHGAVLYDPKGNILSQMTPPLDTILQAMREAAALKHSFFLYTHDKVYICQDPSDAFQWLPWVAAFGEMAEQGPPNLVEMVENGSIQVIKIAFAQAEGKLDAMHAKATSLPGVVVTKALKETLEMIPEGVDKSVALQKVLDRYQISADHVAAFGDGANDVGMLKMVKYSVAMANGMASPKEAAKHRTVSNDEGGVGVWLQRSVQ